MGDTEFKIPARHSTRDAMWAMERESGIQGRGPCQKHQIGRSQPIVLFRAIRLDEITRDGALGTLKARKKRRNSKGVRRT